MSSPLVEVRRLTKHFTRGRGLFASRTIVRAVDDVSFSIAAGETFGLVGESGSGKTTTGRCMLRLVEPTSGQVLFRGENVITFSRARMRRARRDMQIVFQDPYSSLNPRMRAGAIVEEPLIIHRMGTKPERQARVRDLFSLVGLDPSHLSRYPHEFSGGQRQRIGLARALALNPSFVIADEPVSALDVSIQAQVVNLLTELQETLKLTYLFIAHDLRLVRHICDRVAVMYLGKIVEMGASSSPRRRILIRRRSCQPSRRSIPRRRASASISIRRSSTARRRSRKWRKATSRLSRFEGVREGSSRFEQVRTGSNRTPSNPIEPPRT
jgi:ABC-type oligopeptide transport system ATPase subunit